MHIPEHLDSFRADFAEAVKELEQKYSVQIQLGTIKYTSHSFQVTMTATSGYSKEDSNSREWEIFKREREYYFSTSKREFLKTVHTGDVFFAEGKKYTLVGVLRKSKRYPILVREEGGREVKMTIEYFENHMDHKSRY